MCVCVLENQRNVSGHKQTHCENAVRIKDNPIESDCETQAAHVRQVRDDDFTRCHKQRKQVKSEIYFHFMFTRFLTYRFNHYLIIIRREVKREN